MCVGLNGFVLSYGKCYLNFQLLCCNLNCKWTGYIVPTYYVKNLNIFGGDSLSCLVPTDFDGLNCSYIENKKNLNFHTSKNWWYGIIGWDPLTVWNLPFGQFECCSGSATKSLKTIIFRAFLNNQYS